MKTPRMRLYHHPFSSNARRAVMTAVHLNLEVELVVVDLAKGGQKSPEFLAKNPNGRVPVLEDDDFVLWESHAIMSYLAEKTPGQSLYPSELRARADVQRWLFWSAQHFAPAVSVLNWEHVVKPLLEAGPAVPADVERGERLVIEFGRVLDTWLKDRTWLAQDRVTLADLAVSSPLMSLHGAKLPLQDMPHLMAWFQRVQELPAWQKTNL